MDGINARTREALECFGAVLKTVKDTFNEYVITDSVVCKAIEAACLIASRTVNEIGSRKEE